MKKNGSLIGLVLLGLVGSALAKHHETFAERPSKRQAAVERARERATREKKEAREWAKARGIPMRRVDGQQVRELMAIRNGRPVYYSTKNAKASISTAANLVRDTESFGATGAGVAVGVWDGGSVLATHQEFGSRVENKNSGGTDPHSTHVAGTIGAAGIAAAAKGMAPNTEIDSYDWDNDLSEMTSRAASEPGQPDKLYLSNHSYGHVNGWEGGNGIYFWFGDSWSAGAEEEFFGQYVSEANDWDSIVYDAPYFLPFKAAGNDRNDNPSPGDQVYNGEGDGTPETYDPALHPVGDGTYKNGYDTVNPGGTAKNIMTVGAVNDAVLGGSRSVAKATMTTFSSWGPADDGRIKPDIVANGYQLYSCDDDNNSDYYTMSGTSMSSPNACGSAALLVDYYDNLFPGEAMRASTLKGLIIHTADDLGRPGPDYSNGWGLMNTLAAAELLRDFSSDPTRLKEEMLSNANRSDTHTFFSNGNEPVRVTLCWTDPPGTPSTEHDDTEPRLINDLDLKVVGPDGTFWPYKLSHADPSANATATGENDIDNVEQVYIATPTAGKYTAMIDYDTLSGGSQWYSLLVSGPGSDLDSDGMPDYWESEYFMNPTGAIATVDSDGDGADNLTEYISGYSPTDPGSVFEITDSTPPPGGNAPFILVWNPVAGRVYDVWWSDNMIYSPFTVIRANIPYTQNSYTDTVERTALQNFYRVDVRLDQ